MARTVRLDALRAQVRRRADQESGGQSNQQLCSEPELNDYINAAWCELYEMLIGWGQEYFLLSSSITTVSGTSDYDLPSDFFKLRGVDVTLSSDETFSAHPYMFEERNSYRLGGSWQPGWPVWYRLKGDSIGFIPIPTGVYTATLWYYPVPATLVSDGNTLDGVNGWDDFVVVTAAAKAAAKEESDGLVAQLTRERMALIQRIQSSAPSRDAGAPERVQDVVGGAAWR